MSIDTIQSVQNSGFSSLFHAANAISQQTTENTAVSRRERVLKSRNRELDNENTRLQTQNKELNREVESLKQDNVDLSREVKDLSSSVQAYSDQLQTSSPTRSEQKAQMADEVQSTAENYTQNVQAAPAAESASGYTTNTPLTSSESLDFFA